MTIHKQNNMRYERKFRLDADSLHSFYFWLKKSGSRFGFKRSYENRSINNLYFESKNFTAFDDNVEGYSDRSKLRIRWYGKSSNVNKPKLEIKTKKNAQGFKTSCEIKSFDINNIPKIENLLSNKDKDIKYHLYQYPMPAIINSYDRQYYSNSHGVRITIDTNIKYKKPNKFNNFLLRGSYAILEIKYESNDYNVASDILSSIPNALEKNSKYVVGFSCMYHKMIV